MKTLESIESSVQFIDVLLQRNNQLEQDNCVLNPDNKLFIERLHRNVRLTLLATKAELLLDSIELSLHK